MHGIDWPMLKKMVPTRKRLQIKSHLRKYFNQIKKIYGLEDPMEYIKTNTCENLRFHKNEHYGTQKKEIEKENVQQEKEQIGDTRPQMGLRGGLGGSEEVGGRVEVQRSVGQKRRDVKCERKLGEDIGGDERVERQIKEQEVFEVKEKRSKQETPEIILKSFSQNQFPEKIDEKASIAQNIPVFEHEAIIKSTVPIDIKISPGQHTNVNIIPTTNENYLPAQPISFCMQVQGNWQSLNPTYFDPTTLANQFQPSNSYHQGRQNQMDYKLVKLLSSCYCM
mmetsp:Transcript_28707/g.28438  ORF Transcript_28707/g.28438 Transcript_28707/m.28438 type:complete len:279 (-) Transcript_28707:68-904(-)